MKLTPTFFRPFSGFALVAGLLFSTSACHKDAEMAPGTIAATISPAGQVTQVTATDAAGRVYAVLPDNATGAFTLANLPAGAYTLTIATKLAYKTPAPQQVQVKAGTTMTLPPLTLTRDATVRGTLSWVENGTPYTATTLAGEISPALVSVDGYVAVNGVGHEVAFVLPTRGQASNLFTGLGTYALGVQEYPFGKYIRKVAADSYIWYTPTSGAATGQVTVTQYDPAAFSMSGTFSFQASPFSNPTGAAGDATITDGKFTLTY